MYPGALVNRTSGRCTPRRSWKQLQLETPVWGKFFFTIRWGGATLSLGIPIHRAVEDKNFSLWRFE
jgi:hypothetical protein